MRHNRNALPPGKALPVLFKGKNPIHVANVVIDEDPKTEESWRVLCNDGSYVTIKESELVDAPKETKKEK